MGLTSLLVLAALCIVVDGAQVSRVAVLHRHGARTSFQVVNGTFNCNYPYCELTPQGVYQSRAVGSYLRTHYGAVLGLSPQYNVSQVHSESTDVSRVSKSASAALMAMFEGSESLPYVMTTPLTSDEKMSPWTSVPAWLLSNRKVRVNERITAEVTALATPENIAFLEVFYGFQGKCKSRPLLCVGLANDQAMCNTTAGIPVNPEVNIMLPQLQAAVAHYLSDLAGYFPDHDPVSKAVGSYGLPWAREAISFFKGDIYPGVSVAHYAAHDYTVVSVLAALGSLNVTNRNDPSMIPRFSATVLLEYFTNDTVRVLYGAPGQGLADDYTLSMEPLWVRCSNAGAEYWSDSGCPLKDLLEGVELTAGKSHLGSCFHTAEFMEDAQCSTTNQSPNAVCTFFRQKCPNVDCGGIEGAFPDPARGYACQLVGAYTTESPLYIISTMLAVIVPSLILGGLAGFCGYQRWRTYRKAVATTAP